MKHRYLVTGYSKKDGKMATHVYDNIEIIAALINQSEDPNELGKAQGTVINSVKDLEFDVQSRASHLGAEIISTSKYCWSIFLLK